MRTIQHLRTVARLAYLCAAFLALSAFERVGLWRPRRRAGDMEMARFATRRMRRGR